MSVKTHYTLKEIQEAGLDDFRVCLRQVWDRLELPKPTNVQNDMAKWLQNPGSKRMILCAFRGVGKSWITATFVVWLLFMNPDLKIMVVSANGDYAMEISKFMKKIIRLVPFFQHLEPKADEDRADLWTVGPAKPSKDPSVKSVGITGQLTGSRADIVLFDDVEVPKNTQTYNLREKLSKSVMEASAILKPHADSRIIYLGTPQVEDSLYIRLLNRGYMMRVWPSEIPEDPESYGGPVNSTANRLAPFVKRRIEAGWKPHTPIDPLRFDAEELRERKADYGVSGYALQFMLDVNPASADKRPLKLKNLLITDVDRDQGHVKLVWSQDRPNRLEDLQAGGMDGDFYTGAAYKSPEMQKWAGTVMAIDPSGRGKDETAYAILRYLNGMIYLVDCGGFIDGYAEETLRNIAYQAALHGVTKWVAEENYGGGMFTNLLKPFMAKEYLLPDGSRRRGGQLDEEFNGWSRGQKEVRILDTLEPLINNHRLVVDRRVIEEDLIQQMDDAQYSLIWQMTRMERQKDALPHEDRLEVVAIGASYWIEKMDRDRDKAVDLHKERALDDELKRFIRAARAVGHRPQGRSSGPMKYA